MEMSYEKALAELEEILRSMQSEQCDIDKLGQMTKRATQLLKACRAKLTATEEELRQILDQLEDKQ